MLYPCSQIGSLCWLCLSIINGFKFYVKKENINKRLSVYFGGREKVFILGCISLYKLIWRYQKDKRSNGWWQLLKASNETETESKAVVVGENNERFSTDTFFDSCFL